MTRLDKLKDLEDRLLGMMDEADEKTLPALARQYRDTIREIDELEGAQPNVDKISEILKIRADNGKSGTVRKSRAKVSGD